MKQWGKVYRGKRVPAGAHIPAYAIQKILKRPAMEEEIINVCNQMKWDGLHDFDLGTRSNCRNRIQRNWKDSAEYKKFGRPPHNYAAIFIHIKKPGQRVHWWVVEDFDA